MTIEKNNVQNKNLKTSRRGFPRYKKSPFLQLASNNTKSGVKRITSGNDRFMVVNQETGEYVGGAGFFQYQEVDKTQFLKLYINGVRALRQLSSSGGLVFEVLYRAVQDHKDSDRVFLAFDLIDQNLVKISESTFFRGMRELINKGFIAESTVQNSYFINPDYIFNGDRLTFVKTYILTETKSIINKKTKKDQPKLENKTNTKE
ncbi:replication protein [Salmonella enterica]|nr:replication protein [Salmonella enterica]